MKLHSIILLFNLGFFVCLASVYLFEGYTCVEPISSDCNGDSENHTKMIEREKQLNEYLELYAKAGKESFQEYQKYSQNELYYMDLKGFNKGKFLGNGTWGNVYKAEKGGHECVIKLQKESIPIPFLQKEITIHKLLEKAPNVVKFYGLVQNYKKTFVQGSVMEYVKHVPLDKLYGKLSPEDIRYYLYMILLGMEYAHSKGIMHRDLKPDNIAVNPKTRALHILDWGTAEFYGSDEIYEPFIGTPSFKPPEVLLFSLRYHYGWDVWSLGVMFASMIFNKAAFYDEKGEDQSQILNQISEQFGTERIFNLMEKHNVSWPYGESLEPKDAKGWEMYINKENEYRVIPEALDLLDQMLRIDPDERITIKEAMGHKYFDSIREDLKEEDMSKLIHEQSPIAAEYENERNMHLNKYVNRKTNKYKNKPSGDVKINFSSDGMKKV